MLTLPAGFLAIKGTLRACARSSRTCALTLDEEQLLNRHYMEHSEEGWLC